jgi:DNA-binding beta-propeller fold protein YncE
MKPTHSFILRGSILGLFACLTLQAQSETRSIVLAPIGTAVASSIPQPDQSPAEIVAHDPETQRLFVVNAVDAKLDVFVFSDPSKPKLFKTIDIKPYGSVANSVAIRGGYAAVAVEGAKKTDPGSVVFFRTSNLKPLAQVTVGALPDMVAFSPDGRYVVTANEGEPSNDYTVDPEGSVSVIDVAAGVQNVKQANVRSAGFGAFATQTLLDAGIRIFGPGATVAQDIEPEFVTISADSKTAYVTLQENNAIAVVDLATATVTKLLPLGYKDHSTIAAETEIHTFDPAQMPSIGTTLAGQELTLGGFSGLAFEGIDPVSGFYNFVSHTDRGPNAEPNAAGRPFLLPEFTPEVVRFQVDPSTGTLVIRQRIQLQRAPGVPLTGVSNLLIAGGNANTKYNDELPVDLLNQPLPLDPFGADLEGIAFAADGSFWMCDEYRPALCHFDSTGLLIDRLVPIGTAAAAGMPAGTYGREVLRASWRVAGKTAGLKASRSTAGKSTPSCRARRGILKRSRMRN